MYLSRQSARCYHPLSNNISLPPVVLRWSAVLARYAKCHGTFSTLSEQHTDCELLATSPSSRRKFQLSSSFVSAYASRVKAPFGFNGLGELVYQRTYARDKRDGGKEAWHETVERVVNGTYNMQKRWIEQHELGWDARKAQASAQVLILRFLLNRALLPALLDVVVISVVCMTDLLHVLMHMDCG
jgi:hypothetical protein